MNRLTLLFVCGVLTLGVAGCSTMKRATGQLDDTVLPGQRENVLPPEQQTARDPNVARGSAASPDLASQCAPGEPNCIGAAAPEDTATYQEPVIADEPPPVVTKPPAKKVAAKKPVKKKKPIVKKPVPSRTAPANPEDAIPPDPAPSDQPPSL